MKTLQLKRRSTDEHEEVDAEGSWAVSYGDMVTLLLTFFILFFSTEPTKKDSQRQALKISLIETLQKNSSQPVVRAPKGVASMSTMSSNANEVGMDSEVLKAWNGVAHDMGNHVVIDFPQVSFFRSGKVDLTAEGAVALKQFVQVYMPYAGNYTLSVRAFTDTKQVKAIKNRKFEDNLELSALRAVAGMRVLQHSGIPLDRIKLGGYGESTITAKELESVAPQMRGLASDKEALSLARRIVLVIEPEEK